jgi:hypothetical protein
MAFFPSRRSIETRTPAGPWLGAGPSEFESCCVSCFAQAIGAEQRALRIYRHKPPLPQPDVSGAHYDISRDISCDAVARTLGLTNGRSFPSAPERNCKPNRFTFSLPEAGDVRALATPT